MFMLVCLNGLVSFLTCGLCYVNVAHFSLSSLAALMRGLCCIFAFSHAMNLVGKLLFSVVFCIVCHSACSPSSVNGSDSILLT